MNRTAMGKRLAMFALVVLVSGAVVGLIASRNRVNAASLMVTNLNDNGPGSLRQAILDTNAAAGADTINFQAGLTGTITLTTGHLVISDGLTINGPGENVLTVSGNNESRIFDIALTVVMISGLTISNGASVGFDHGDFGGGGGIFNFGTLTITNSTLSNNSASSNLGGGGVFNLNTLTVTNSTLSGNVSGGGAGGGISNYGSGRLTVENSTISGNSGANGGGIVNVGGILTITNSTISGNSGIVGGGILNGGILNITNSTVSGNSAGGVSNRGVLTIVNSTFSNNSTGGSGGGISNHAETDPTVTATIINSTFSGNSAQIGGAIAAFQNASPDATVTIKNSIVANSPLGGNCGGDGILSALGINFSTDDSCPGFTQVPSTGPGGLNLGPLHVNAPGSTATHALLAGSVAIDAVMDCTDLSDPPQPVDIDQRGVARPIDGDGFDPPLCDAGAYEAPACTKGDGAPPQITCPANVIAKTALACPPATGATLTYSAPMVSDICPGATAVCSPPSGSTFALGATIVTCTATDVGSNTASCSFTVTVFNGCLQDDSNSNNVLLFNTVTGAYRFCCNGTVFTGTGTATLRGCTFSMQHNAPDRRLLINADFSLKKGTASLQFPPGTVRCTITDRDMANDTSKCP